MTYINIINNLSNAAIAKPDGGSADSQPSSEIDWFCDNSNSSITISATPVFKNGTSIDDMNLSILSCIAGFTDH